MAQRFLARQTLLRHPQGIATAMCTTRRSAVRSNTVISQSSSALSSYAMVSHAKEYSEAMGGRHGKQLDLAWKEGSMKHDRNQPFDPFAHYKVNDDVDDDVDDVDDNNNNNNEEEEIVGDMKDMNDMNEQKEEDSSERNGDSDTLTATLDAIQYTYTNDGSLSMPHSTRAAHIAGAPAGGAFAVISLGNTGIQHKVTIHDVITSNKLKPVDAWAVGTTHTIGIGIGESDGESDSDNSDANGDANGDADNTRSDANAAGQVLLVGDSNRTCVGLPFVQGAQVDVMVEEITRDQTVIVFKKKRRKNHRRKNGFRREVTFLRVLDIRFPAVHHAKEEEREEGTRGTLVDDTSMMIA